MTERRFDRFHPLAGIVAVVLWVVGFVVVEGGSSTDAESPADVLAAYQDDTGAIVAGGFLAMLGAVFFLWFVGSLRNRLAEAEGGIGNLTPIAFAGGIATAICLLLVPGPNVAAAINENDLSAEAAQAMSVVDDAFFVGAELSAIVLLVATGLLALRTGLFPRWFAWVSFLIALVLVIAPIGWAALIFAFPLWVLAASLMLFMRGERAGAAPVESPA